VLVNPRQPQLADEAATRTRIGVSARIIRRHGKQYPPLDSGSDQETDAASSPQAGSCAEVALEQDAVG